MAPEVLAQLRAREMEISRRWEILLRVEPVSGPLANPDALTHLIPRTLADLWTSLAAGTATSATIAAARSRRLPDCECGNNPYLAYFIAAEQALLEALILVQASRGAPGNHELEAAEVIDAVRTRAKDEIDAFCGVCLHRCRGEKCRQLEPAV